MARYPLIGYLTWAVLFGALFAWEGLALAGVTGVPAPRGVVRVIMRCPAGRRALFALWLWAGWYGRSAAFRVADAPVGIEAADRKRVRVDRRRILGLPRRGR